MAKLSRKEMDRNAAVAIAVEQRMGPIEQGLRCLNAGRHYWHVRANIRRQPLCDALPDSVNIKATRTCRLCGHVDDGRFNVAMAAGAADLAEWISELEPW